MDIIETLKVTREIWYELAQDSRLEKIDIPLSHIYDCLCPCCSYVNEKTNNSSERMTSALCQDVCPLWEAWGNQFCEDGTSPYNMWGINGVYYRSLYDRQFFALLIVEWADYLLNQYEATHETSDT